jgi:putative endonuclease
MIKKYSPTQLFGYKAEKLACEFLKKQGLEKIKSNYLTHLGEIDLIMQDAKSIIFVEVRARQQGSIVSSAASVNYKKRKKIIRTATWYLQKNSSAKTFRFDVVAIQSSTQGIEIDWIKDAFRVQ